MKWDKATQRQIKAAEPSRSTWLSANAGSGKTKVLTDRVSRLLLEGVPPQNILCLTYTKAAATEMQNRLFKRLGTWAMARDSELRKDLTQLGTIAPDGPDGLANARTLFASALETPGGLRIQTIHSFCASLLRRFPLEAGISPMFREMDERAANQIQEDVLDQLANSPDKPVLDSVSHYLTAEDLTGLTESLTRYSIEFQTPARKSTIWQTFELPKNFDATALLKDVFLGSESVLFKKLIPLMENSEKKTDQKNSVILSQINLSNPNLDSLGALIRLFIYDEDTKKPFTPKTDRFPTSGLRKANPETTSEIHELMSRVADARDHYFALLAAEKTLALHKFAAAFLPRYQAEKTARAWLDFDDLINRAGQLLSNPSVAQWVLFRLDGGLDHILIDEAQDTNPDQWRIIALLAQEFSVGQGARSDIKRTIFVVGDLKQSIYSFQGADPTAFGRMQHHFTEHLESAGQPLQVGALEHSFRSSSAILEFVDSVFSTQGNSGLGGAPTHLAFHKDLPGRVDLWPIVPVAEAPDEKPWYDPTDKPGQNDHNIILAKTIAKQIQDLVNTGSIPGENGKFRPIRYDDFLILVQSRSPLFHHIIRACKSLGLPVAGADRLKVAAELAVKDLIALFSFLSLPNDDLSLAAALRSPLFGIMESELFELSYHRSDKSLWQALQEQRESFVEQCDTLEWLLTKTDFFNPFELLESLLTRFHGRERLVARLGPEAEAGIDALLSLALEYESRQTPSLTGFIGWLESDDVIVKRQIDAMGGQIRVMTTHGAKGLESPIVILPDTGEKRAGREREITLSQDGIPLWRMPKDQRSDVMKSALTRDKTAEMLENQRLLYVALTRAEKWLILCGSGSIKDLGDSWYRQVELGMDNLNSQSMEFPVGVGRRYQHGEWVSLGTQAQTIQSESRVPLPNWLVTRVKTPTAKPQPISPSDLGGSHSLVGHEEGQERDIARLRGKWLHKLLEHFPSHQRETWPKVAKIVLSTNQGRASLEDVESLIRQASDIITDPKLAHLFGPNSMAEVGFTANLSKPDIGQVQGVIDRLIVNDDRVLIVDFKSNAQVPNVPKDIPNGILRQLGAYLDGIEQIYRNRTVEVAILWTATKTLMPVPHDIVRDALRSMPHLDLSTHDP